MTPAEAKSAISILRPSSLCARSLPNPQLSGELIEDELGNMHILVTAELTDGSPIVTSTLSRATTGTRVSIIGAAESVTEEVELSGTIAQTSLN